jgi:uncharacterized membrane protein SpoIIM required for sporulation
MFVPAFVSYFVVLANPDAAYAIASPRLIDEVHHHQLWTHIPPEVRVEEAGLIMTHNIWVSMLAFAFGVVFGLPVIWVMVSNGISLGGLFGLTQAYGLSGGLFDFVIAHGVLELSIVITQGAGGLMLGWALISPGNRTRSDALAAAAPPAFTLLLGLAPLLVVAGTIEGNISPSDAPFAIKLAIGLTTGLLFYSYLLLTGRANYRSARSLSSR